MRGPIELDIGIDEHRTHFRAEPILIMLRDTYVNANRPFFNHRLHSLCCGKGALYRGIPALVTPSSMVEDYLICY